MFRQSIFYASGATMAVSYVLEALCAPGEHVLTETPGFDIFRIAAAVEHLELSEFSRLPAFRRDLARAGRA